MNRQPSAAFALTALLAWAQSGPAQDVRLPTPAVEGQPLAAAALRLVSALEFLGAPLPDETAAAIHDAARRRDAARLQQLIDPHVLLQVSLNPEVRIKVARGPAKAVLQQGGFTPLLVKVLNHSTVTETLSIQSPQAGPLYSGASPNSLTRQQQTELIRNENKQSDTDRFLQVEVFRAPPMTANLSGLEVEYVIALVYSSEAGKREATISFDVGGGNQDLGFRGETPVLFDVRPAIPVRLSIRDHDGRPTAARLVFRDSRGRVYPPQARRLAPDFFFQPQVYRQDGESVLLPPGEFTVHSCRGPEYRVVQQLYTVPDRGPAELEIQLRRWVNPVEYGFYCGDHHIHGAGCAHYDNPTQGVTPRDMFVQVKGEGLNVGCVLTWGPCFDFQRQYFSPQADDISEPLTLLKYDLEISGFGSAALGHVCLLNLNDQTYPGSEGTKTKGWPTWTVPVMRWTKQQGGVTGYPHSAMYVDPPAAARRLLDDLDQNADRQLSAEEAQGGLLPESFTAIDADDNGSLSEREVTASMEQAADQLPNLVISEMNGSGAMEIFVSTAEGVCDFISAMDTARIGEWNTWYHLLNCGFPLKLSGETDFPCMSSRRVGQGRVYVQLGNVQQIDFGQWCRGLAEGRSYVSDGFAHALEFHVAGQSPGGEEVRLDAPGEIPIQAKVSFAEEMPRAVAYGSAEPTAGRRVVGDTRILHMPRTAETVRGGHRLVELVVNGQPVHRVEVAADGKEHKIDCRVRIDRSSWVALRQFPQLHTNPVNVIVADAPIRVSRASARWCAESIKLLWQRRHNRIAEHEREAAHAAYQRAIRMYEKIAAECPAEPGN